MLTTEQIRTLNDARTILRDLETPHDWAGGFAKAVVRDAEQGVFEALNVLHAYLDVAVSDDQMHNRETLDVTRSLGRADSVIVEGMEDGFEMKIGTDRGVYVVNVHGVTEDVVVAGGVVAEWYAEGRQLAHEHAVFACNPDESLGYATDDPKHPDWHSVHADIYDSREGK